jgi:hypothetical protein
MKLISLSIQGPAYTGPDIPTNTPIPIVGAGGMPTGGIEGGILNKILGTGFSVLVIIGIILCLYVLVLSGWQWIFSSGDKQSIGKVRQRISYALVGLVVIFISFVLINLLTNFFGITVK